MCGSVIIKQICANFPILILDFTLVQMENAKMFSKLNANNGHWQILLTKEFMALTPFLSLFGRIKFRALTFGLFSAPEIFQNLITQVLKGVKGMLCHFDDYEKVLNEHDGLLEAVLKRSEGE